MSYYGTSPSQQQPQPSARQLSGGPANGGGMGVEEGEAGEEVELVEYKHQLPPTQPYILGEDEKIPLFLVKMWNIVEDPANYDVIKWDGSGYSFHITDPYSFCRNVLPQFFKHNNLNSLIRQLNMYGFRKMTPIERTSLARAESDQDHLEFSHPFFVRDHPELLINIKRKAPSSRQHEQQAALAAKGTTSTMSSPSKDLTSVFDELHQLRERQKVMESKMTDLVKENELIWREMDHMRGAHFKQQQIVNKLVQFLVALVQPANKQQRIGKRHLLAIDERGVDSKRSRAATDSGWEGGLGEQEDSARSSALTQQNTTEMLDRLMDELGREQMFGCGGGGGVGLQPTTMRPIGRFSPPKRPDSNGSSGGSATSGGPIIAEVTDDFDQLASGAPALQPQAQPSYSAYGDRRYPARVNRGYTSGARVESGAVQSSPRGVPVAVQQQQRRSKPPPVTYLPPQPTATHPTPPQLITKMPANNVLTLEPPQSMPRYFTRQYQQQQQLPPLQGSYPAEPLIQYNSDPVGNALITPAGMPVTQCTHPSVSPPQPAFPIVPMRLPPTGITTTIATVPPAYKSVAPSVNTANMGMRDPLMPSAVIQPETGLSNVAANEADKQAGAELTEDEFNEYLSQNDMAISNLRGQFGNIWDFDADNLFDLEDADHAQISEPKSVGEKSGVVAGYGSENGNERPCTLSPLSNVPTETSVRSCTKQTRRN